MAYNDFTLDTLMAQFSLQVQEESNYFMPFAPLSMSDLLRQTLQENVPLALNISTEKARSEFIIAPVLLEVRRQLDHRISLFSGVEFNVNLEEGLRGVCDFLLSLSPLQLTIQAPVVMVVEAKNENVKQGISQCIAERSYWIPESWHVRMVYTDDIPFHDPSQESNRAGQHQASRR